VQSVVDDKNNLIVASEVVNRSDAGHLHAMAKAAKEVLGAETRQALADVGYYSSADLKACEDDGISPMCRRPRATGKQGRFSRKDFSCDSAADAYGCPAGELLRPTKARFTNTSGRVEIRYLSRKAICDTCTLKARCLAPKSPMGLCAVSRSDIGAIKTDNPFYPSPREPFSAEPESDCSGWGFDTLSRPTICTLNRDYLRFRTLKVSFHQAKEFWSAGADRPASGVSA
jgi:hypothetical protein